MQRQSDPFIQGAAWDFLLAYAHVTSCCYRADTAWNSNYDVSALTHGVTQLDIAKSLLIFRRFKFEMSTNSFATTTLVVILSKGRLLFAKI